MAGKLDQAKIFYDVEIKWIKGHVGHVGNEYSDMMAIRGTRVVLKQIREHSKLKCCGTGTRSVKGSDSGGRR